MPTLKWLKNWNNYYYFRDVPVHASSITLNKNSISLTSVWQTEQLTATVYPDDAVEKKVHWSSSDITIATVNQMGIVTCVTPGECTITAECEWVTATCSVQNIIYIDYILVWWWGWGWSWNWNCSWWGWGWGWQVLVNTLCFQSSSLSIVIWEWWIWQCYPDSWRVWNWWDSCIWDIVAKWWCWWNEPTWWASWSWCTWWWSASNCSWWGWGWWASWNWEWGTTYCWDPEIWTWWTWLCWYGWWGWGWGWMYWPASWWWSWASGPWRDWWGNWAGYYWWGWWNATNCWWWGWWGWWRQSSPPFWWGNWAWWVAIICYKTDWSCWISCATWWTITTSGDYTVHTFTSSWTFCII